ncbi:hypothetical protein [Microcoleus anatoxicus]|uniref:hypothetical protein n=1 Tax=Microcoleus anatoxicus TaxID=2705319 RepID=UPI0030C947CA
MSNLWKTYKLPVETLWNIAEKLREKIRIAKGDGVLLTVDWGMGNGELVIGATNNQ